MPEPVVTGRGRPRAAEGAQGGGGRPGRPEGHPREDRAGGGACRPVRGPPPDRPARRVGARLRDEDPGRGAGRRAPGCRTAGRSTGAGRNGTSGRSRSSPTPASTPNRCGPASTPTTRRQLIDRCDHDPCEDPCLTCPSGCTAKSPSTTGACSRVGVDDRDFRAYDLTYKRHGLAARDRGRRFSGAELHRRQRPRPRTVRSPTCPGRAVGADRAHRRGDRGRHPPYRRGTWPRLIVELAVATNTAPAGLVGRAARDLLTAVQVLEEMAERSKRRG